MSRIKDEKKVKGKQSNYVNTNVKEFDTDMWGEYNLFGERIEDTVPEKFPHLVQLGNLHIDRTGFYNPQDTRVYSPMGTCPTLTLSFSPRFLFIDNGEYRIRRLSGFESMRMMGVEDEDIQKLVDGGLSNNQLAQLAGNSIVVDCMSEFFKEMIKH
jgi:site-specific DNA-cytosine methylase